MNPLTSAKRIQNINAKEASLGISDKASWYSECKKSVYVFVGGIPDELTEGDLLAVFAQYGEIVDCDLGRDKGTGKSNGFAFIGYEDQRSTNLAVDNLNGAAIWGEKIRVDHASFYKIGDEDEETEQIKREEHGVCRAFQRGEGTSGAGCKFSRDEQSQMGDVATRIPTHFGDGFGPRHTMSRNVDASALRRRDKERLQQRDGAGPSQTTAPLHHSAEQRMILESESDSDDSPPHQEQGRRYGRFASSASSGSGKRSRSGEDKSWIVKEPVPGGPFDCSVIPSFLGHVASRFLIGETRGVLKCQQRTGVLHKIKDWFNRMPEQGRRLLIQTGLSHLQSTMYDHLDVPLICAFVERWQPDTNSFHMPFGEMTIMLHDVQHILGIPIDGQLITDDPTPEESQAECIELLGVRSQELLQYYWAHGAILNQSVLDLSRANRSPRDQAILWLGLLLGSTLFPDKSGNRFRPSSLHELIDGLDSVPGYSWGAAALAYLYRHLGISSRGDCQGMTGCLTLLQAWIYEYFPCFRPHREPMLGGQGFPRAITWSVVAPNRSETRLEYLRGRIDQLTAGEVLWLPFGPLKELQGHRTIFTGWVQYRDIIEPYMPNRVLRQVGYIQTIPGRIYRPLTESRPWRSVMYKVVHPASTADDAWTQFPLFHTLILSFFQSAEEDHTACEDGYIEWYYKVSHPLFSGVESSWGSSVPSRANSEYWVRRSLTIMRRFVTQMRRVDSNLAEEQAAQLAEYMEQWNLAP